MKDLNTLTKSEKLADLKSKIIIKNKKVAEAKTATFRNKLIAEKSELEKLYYQIKSEATWMDQRGYL